MAPATFAAAQSDTAGPGRGAADVPATPDDGGPRNWEVAGVSSALNLREQPSTTGNIIARYAPGTILHISGVYAPRTASGAMSKNCAEVRAATSPRNS